MDKCYLSCNFVSGYGPEKWPQSFFKQPTMGFANIIVFKFMGSKCRHQIGLCSSFKRDPEGFPVWGSMFCTDRPCSIYIPTRISRNCL